MPGAALGTEAAGGAPGAVAGVVEEALGTGKAGGAPGATAGAGTGDGDAPGVAGGPVAVCPNVVVATHVTANTTAEPQRPARRFIVRPIVVPAESTIKRARRGSAGPSAKLQPRWSWEARPRTSQ